MNIQDDNSEALSRFDPIARQFCSLVDSACALSRTDFVVQVYHMLPRLIGEGMLLPEVDWGDDENEEQDQTVSQLRRKATMTDEEWGQLYNSLKERLGDWDLYWEVFDPLKDSEAIHGSLADDIADIYRDLKNGINLKETGRIPSQEIIFEWRFGFYSHWGKHAIDALRTIHFLIDRECVS